MRMVQLKERVWINMQDVVLFQWFDSQNSMDVLVVHLIFRGEVESRVFDNVSPKVVSEIMDRFLMEDI